VASDSPSSCPLSNYARELEPTAAVSVRAGLKFQELGRDRANRLDQPLEALSVESADLHPNSRPIAEFRPES
jgi:hypothetical protein